MNEHNPIAQELIKIHAQWLQSVPARTHTSLIRFLIRPEEARIYEGFLKLESSPHGRLSEIFVTQLTSFAHAETFSAQLIEDWLTAFANDTKTQDALRQAGRSFNWDAEHWRELIHKRPHDNHDLTLLQMLAAFRAALPGKDPQLVFALLPREVNNTSGLGEWCTTLLRKGMPAGVRLLLIDHLENSHFDEPFARFPDRTLTLAVPLQVREAIRKIATQGSPNDPEVELRRCMFEMGKALQGKNQKQLHYWGQKALECTQRSGHISLFATTHLMYAGMLFHFRDDERIGQLLHTALRLSQKGAERGDKACIPLLIQSHGYLGAWAQLRRKTGEALDHYMRQAAASMEHRMPQQAITAYHLASELARRKDRDRYKEILALAYTAGMSLTDEEIRTSVFIYLLRSYYDVALERGLTEVCRAADERMVPLFGPQWKEEADRMKKEKMPQVKSMPPVLQDEEQS